MDTDYFGTLNEYVAQWKRNRKCCETIDSVFPDWQITVAFYTALHAVNAALAKLHLQAVEHHARNRLVKENEFFAPIRQKYLTLYRLSRFTRYDPRPDEWLPERYLTAQHVVDDLLRPIEIHVQSIVKPDATTIRDVKLKG